MATSGVTTWQLTATDIIDAALRKLAVIGSGVSPSSTQRTEALQALNAMLKLFQAKGMPLWAVSEYSFPLIDEREYTIGVGQTLSTPAPLKVLQAYLADTTQMTSVPMNIVTREDYNLNQPISEGSGPPIDLLYIPGNQRGTIKLWPTPDTYSQVNCEVTIVYQRPAQDMVNLTDHLDFPQHWHEAIIYGLANRLAPEYSIPQEDRAGIKVEATEFLNEALSFDGEEGSFTITPEWDR